MRIFGLGLHIGAAAIAIGLGAGVLTGGGVADAADTKSATARRDPPSSKSRRLTTPARRRLHRPRTAKSTLGNTAAHSQLISATSEPGQPHGTIRTMTGSTPSQARRRTRWIGACVIALGLGAGVAAGSGVAFADEGTVSTSIAAPTSPGRGPASRQAQNTQFGAIVVQGLPISPQTTAGTPQLGANSFGAGASPLPGSDTLGQPSAGGR
jgi:hypothetical protein